MNESVEETEREAALHPIDLGLLAREKLQLMIKGHLSLSSEGAGILFDRGIAPFKTVTPEPFEHLDRLETRIVRVPLLNQTFIGSYQALALGLSRLLGPSQHPGDFLSRDSEHRPDLSQTQTFHLAQMMDSAPKLFVHGHLLLAHGSQCRSRPSGESIVSFIRAQARQRYENQAFGARSRLLSSLYDSLE